MKQGLTKNNGLNQGLSYYGTTMNLEMDILQQQLQTTWYIQQERTEKGKGFVIALNHFWGR